MSSSSQKIFMGGVWVTIGKGVAAVCALLLNTLVARMLPPDAVGGYFLLVSIVTLFALAAQLGSHQAIIRLIAGESGPGKGVERRTIIKSASLVVGVGIILTCMPYAFGGGEWLGRTFFESDLIGRLSLLTAVWIALRALQTFLSETLRGLHHIGNATLFEGTSTGLIIVVVLACIWMAHLSIDLKDLLLITILALSLSVVAELWIIKKNVYSDHTASSELDIKGVIKIAFPLFLAGISLPGIAEAHLWVLGSVHGAQQVAIYGAAWRLAKFIVIPLFIINSVIPPLVAQLVAQGRKGEVEHILRTTASLAGIPSLVIVFFLAWYAPEVMKFIFGEFYSQGANVLVILIAAQAVNALTGSPGVLMMMSDGQSRYMQLAIFSGMTGLVTTLVLVKPFGYTGVAFGASTGMVLINIGTWWYCLRRLGIKTHMYFDFRAFREIKLFFTKLIMNRVKKGEGDDFSY